MRMETPYRINDTLLRSRISRPKAQFCMLSWFQGPGGQAANNAILGGLSLAQIQANTTRGSTPGLIDPARGRAGGRVYLEHEQPEDDTESDDSDTEQDSGASPVKGSPLIAGPASDGTATSAYESQKEEGDDKKDGGKTGEKGREEYGKKHDREEIMDLPAPKRQRMAYNGQ